MANPNPSPATRFKPGEKPPGNGRPKESRDRITRRFLLELAEHFEANGKEAIAKLYDQDVAKYVQAVAAVVPKEIEISRPLDGMSDEELLVAIHALTDAIRGQAPVPEQDEQPATVN
jgi:hypothetical protein